MFFYKASESHSNVKQDTEDEKEHNKLPTIKLSSHMVVALGWREKKEKSSESFTQRKQEKKDEN